MNDDYDLILERISDLLLDLDYINKCIEPTLSKSRDVEVFAQTAIIHLFDIITVCQKVNQDVIQ